jgi:ribosomal protein S6E (S10)
LTFTLEAIAVSASEPKYRDKIKTVIENKVLKITYDEKGFSWNIKRNLKAYVSFKTLNALSASGGSDIKVEGSIKTKELAIEISGGCDFDGKIEVNKLTIDQSGGSDVTISGIAANVIINASGGSDFNGYNLTTDFCSADASGGSDIEITANKEITARASGASDISFKGNASLKESKSSGASSVNKRS